MDVSDGPLRPACLWKLGFEGSGGSCGPAWVSKRRSWSLGARGAQCDAFKKGPPQLCEAETALLGAMAMAFAAPMTVAPRAPMACPRAEARELRPRWRVVGLASVGLGRLACRARLRYETADLKRKLDTGVSTGWQGLDRIIRPVKGEVVCVCGQPGTGKSEFLLSLAVNLAKLHGWKTGLALLEHKDDQLLLQLVEKTKEQHFEKLSQRHLNRALEDDSDVMFVKDHFTKVAGFAAEVTLEDILHSAEVLAEEGGLQNLILDPYNCWSKPQGLGQKETETLLVSKYMTQLQRFAKKHMVCIWVVVHPTKLSQIKGGPPSLYDMQGSAHWFNKCDKGMLILRNKDPSKGTTSLVELQVDKVRNGASGRIGRTMLNFDVESRSYAEI